jgi:hypothetical protein
MLALLAPVTARSVARADDEPGDGGDSMGPDEGGDLGGGEVKPGEELDPAAKAKLDKAIKRFVELFKKLVHSADTSIVTAFLKYKGNHALLASDPFNCAALCIEAAGYLARAPKDQLEDAAKNAAIFVQIAQKCVDTHKDDRTAKVALAGALTCAIRLDLAQKKDVAPERFVAVADLLVAAYTGGTADSGAYLIKGVGWLREGVDEVVAARAPLIERADKIILLIPTLQEGASRDIALAQARLLRAVALGAAKGGADGDACIAALAPYVSGDQPRDDACTLHNEAVSWAKRSKVVLKAKYIFKRAAVLGQGLGYAVLAGNRWEDHGSSGALFVVVETNHRGRIIRQIECEDFSHNMNYIFDDGGKETKIGGDNSKGLAKKFMLEAKEKTFTSITAQKDLVKAPFAKQLTQAQMFEMTGTGTDGDYLRLHGYIFRAKEAALTYVVRVFEYGDFPKNDPELDAFLDNMFEKPKDKDKK